MKFTVIHNDNIYEFNTANELYIFGIAADLGIEEKLNTHLEAFVTFVTECHKEDCFNAPLEPFTLFIAEWWKELQGRDKQYIANKFYEIRR